MKKYFKSRNFFNQDSGVVEVSDEPEHLSFVLNDQLVKNIEDAETSFQALIDDLELEVLVSRHYGKSFIKSQKFSPDSFVQARFELFFPKFVTHQFAF
jgi:hypothetical protein